MKDYPTQWIVGGLTCREVANRTSDYVDDHLSILNKIRVSLHLASCTHCRAYVAQISLVRDAVAFLPRSFPPPINRLRLRRQFKASHPH